MILTDLAAIQNEQERDVVRDAADTIRAAHGPESPQHAFWDSAAYWLDLDARLYDRPSRYALAIARTVNTGGAA